MCAECTTEVSGFFAGDGSAGDPYLICNWTQLSEVRNNLDSNFVLVNNLDAGTGDYFSAGGDNWEPIGFGETVDWVWQGEEFIGNFDGNNKTISDLNINRPGGRYIGLFAYLESSSEISNLGLLDGNVTGYQNVGGIAGYSKGTIANSYNTGDINGTEEVTIGGDPSVYVGGIAGWSNGTINNSYNTGTVYGIMNFGGITGWSEGTVDNCYNNGDIIGYGDYSGGQMGGGSRNFY